MIIGRRDLRGSLSIPPSKSITHRAFILSCIAGGSVKNPLLSEDTKATLDVLSQMGAEYHWDGNTLVVDKVISHGSGSADCRNSGTTLRLLSAVASLFPELSDLGGDDSLNSRPIAGLADALIELGAEVKSSDGTPPILIRGPLPDEHLECHISGNVSSQYISGLLIALSSRNRSSRIYVHDGMVSKPYVDLTIEMLRGSGAKIDELDDGYHISSSPLVPQHFLVPADFSSLAFFAVAGAFGNELEIGVLDTRYTQADSRILEILESFGASIEYEGEKVKVSGDSLVGQKVDLSSCPDLFPIVAVLAAASKGKSILYGAHHLRYKETDRIRAVVDMLSGMSVDVIERDDGCEIQGTGKIKGGSTVITHGDHRIAMAGAICGTISELPVQIDNPKCVEVSFPGFFDILESITK